MTIIDVSEALRLLNVLVKEGDTKIELGDVHSESELVYLKALVSGARAVLDEMGSNGVLIHDKGLIVLRIASAYRPALVELGWWK